MAPLTREERLLELRDTLEAAISACKSTRDLSGLSREYRAVLLELEELSPPDDSDEIDAIVAELNGGDV